VIPNARANQAGCRAGWVVNEYAPRVPAFQRSGCQGAEMGLSEERGNSSKL